MRYNMRHKAGQLLTAKDTGQDKDGISRERCRVREGLSRREALSPLQGRHFTGKTLTANPPPGAMRTVITEL
jgi:hypothetical protein